MNKVEKYYDFEYDEWLRLERHKIEFDITKRHLDEIITKPHSKIFDCGGGPGRYSIYLSQKGHDVTLLDLSSKHIEIAKAKNLELNGNISRFIHGNALTLDQYQLEQYDYILLMGPLYHIIEATKREQVVTEVSKYLKEDGVLFASFISNYAPISDTLKHLLPLEHQGQQLLSYITNGINDDSEGFTVAYFSSKEEVENLMNQCGFQKLRFIAVENIFSIAEANINKFDQDEYLQWLEICYQLGYDEKVFGAGEHYLYIGKKKWPC